MIGGPGWARQDTPLDTPFNRKIHKEYASAMAQPRYVKTPEEYAAAMAAGQNAPRPYPTHYTPKEGGTWFNFNEGHSIKFSDGTIYDTRTKSWRPDRVDPIAQWERNKAADPLASSGMIQAGEHLVREVKQLRYDIAKLREVEDFAKNLQSAKAGIDDDDERDF